MTLCVFLGPSLAPSEARQIIDAHYLPPVQHGDVYRVVNQQQPRIIGIIDGYFRQVPAVWHKEILWAMSQGVQVFGAASMGALRAAELADFGMQGVGRIFSAYRDGVLAPFDHEPFEDDDEVAVMHGPAETGYVAVSEALVNIRCTLAHAHAQGIITSTCRDALVQIGKDLFYPQRRYEKLLQLAAAQGYEQSQLETLRDWLVTNKVNQKRSDAKDLLATIALAKKPAQAPDFHFQHTSQWQNVVTAITDNNKSLMHTFTHWVLDELRLTATDYGQIKQAALLRLIAHQQPPVPVPTKHDVQKMTTAFRQQQALLTRQDLDAWLAAQHLDATEFRHLMTEQARLRLLEQEHRVTLQPYLLDELRSSGRYAVYAERAAVKQAFFENDGTIDATQFNRLGNLQLVAWYCQRQQRPLVESIESLAEELGFIDQAQLITALQRDYCFFMMARETGRETAED